MNHIANATSILVENDQDEVLTASRRDNIEQKGLIGGKQDPGETIEECAMREFYEETGVKLTAVPVKVFEDVCEAGSDGRAFNVTAFRVVDPTDKANIKAAFPNTREVEDGIHVGFSKKQQVVDGPFGAYNTRLFNAIGVKV